VFLTSKDEYGFDVCLELPLSLNITSSYVRGEREVYSVL
jgi:hypothetical protein